jgi:hypothetical protein
MPQVPLPALHCQKNQIAVRKNRFYSKTSEAKNMIKKVV